MSSPNEVVTLSFPRSVVEDLPTFARELNDRMHSLLERNTEGALTPLEKIELETLVQMAQFAQVLATAAATPSRT
jgi:hypothetical protein